MFLREKQFHPPVVDVADAEAAQGEGFAGYGHTLRISRAERFR